MPDERKPVICPWCKNNGITSTMTKQRESVNMTVGEDYYFCPKCHSHSPHISTYNGDWDNASNYCYAAATQRPPNRALTLPELFDLDGVEDAIWVVDSESGMVAMSAEEACEWASDADTVLFFARKPTPEDIEAARKERTI